MFDEFPEVTRQEWESTAAKDSPRFARMMYGPEAAPLPQPWKAASGWEVLGEIPQGLCELPEGPAVAQLRAALASGANEFLVPVDTLYFEEIAKFRALRRLFDSPVRIVAVTGRMHQTVYEPHANLLRATTCAMSAILGGCDALVVRRFDEARGGDSEELARRMALNTQFLLREEAGFGEVADPAAGSWFLESLTQRYVEAARSSEASAVPDVSKRTLIGVTKYADPLETVPDGVEISEDRLATPYEKLRLAVQRSGQTPHVRWILGQDAKMSRARLEFARGVFAAGGFVEGEPASFGVLCAADSEYPGMIAAETKLPLIVAGPETPGAFDCVNLKSDLAAKLAAWLRHLGISTS